MALKLTQPVAPTRRPQPVADHPSGRAAPGTTPPFNQRFTPPDPAAFAPGTRADSRPDRPPSPLRGTTGGKRARPQLFPEGTLEEARGQALLAIAILLTVLAVLLSLAQLSYDPLDPSLNTATDRAVPHNWLGLLGAGWADLGFQLFGYALWLVPGYCLIWALTIVLQDRLSFLPGRLLLLPVALALASLLLTIPGWITGWSKPAFAGGAIGDLLLSNLGHWLYLPEWLSATVSLFLLPVLLGWLCAQPGRFWQALARAAQRALLGLVALLVDLMRLFRGAPAAAETQTGKPWFRSSLGGDQDRLPIFTTQTADGTPAAGAMPRAAQQARFNHPDPAPSHQAEGAAAQINPAQTVAGEAARPRFQPLFADDQDPGDAGDDPLDDDAEEGLDSVQQGQARFQAAPPWERDEEDAGAFADEDDQDDLDDDPFDSDPHDAAAARRSNPPTSPSTSPPVRPAAPAAAGAARARANPEQPELFAPPEAGNRAQKALPSAGKQRAQPAARSSSYDAPALSLLQSPDPLAGGSGQTREQMMRNAELLTEVLRDFGVKGEITNVRPGPVVTLYELKPAPGTKTSRVVNLADDIARSMSALSARIAVVPGRNVIGIELPNPSRETVYLREMLETDAYSRLSAKLPIALGKDIGGSPVYVDLAKMPHLLVAGTTGSGKSVAVNTMILSLLYSLSPERCKFIMVDPKMLELSVYDGIPHLLSPVVTEPKKAVVALNWAVREMEERYRAMSNLGVRNIDGYNKRLEQARKNGEVLTRKVQTGFDVETGVPEYEEQEIDLAPLPFIVIIVDEMADLMLVAGKEIEGALQRLAQMARAAGIHLVMATQRPSVDVITGTIKANFPTRISFHVTSKIDSRTILGEMGAEQLLGQGDMLYMPNGGRIQRVHGPFASDDEVEEVVRHLRDLGEPAYIDEISQEPLESFGDGGGMAGGLEGTGSGDDLYDQAVAIVLRDKKASTSYVQRCLQIGYNRAARLIERMEAEGLISTADRVGRREILAGNPDA